MFEKISPRSSVSARRLVAFLIAAAGELPPEKRNEIVRRYTHVYGDLGGQRALDDEALREVINETDLQGKPSKEVVILALETYFATICNILASAACSGNGTTFLRSLAMEEDDFLDWFAAAASGKLVLEKGIKHYANTYGLDWYIESLAPDALTPCKEIILELSKIWTLSSGLSAPFDHIQLLHDEVFPKNLAHVAGQFYTPSWLCDLLVQDLAPKSDSLILDPFCGSGAFLVATARYLTARGLEASAAVRRVCGIDINPAACIAARTNLVLFTLNAGVTDLADLKINILCADSLAPAITKGSLQTRDLFSTTNTSITIDGTLVDVDPNLHAERDRCAQILASYGVDTQLWLGTDVSDHDVCEGPFSLRDQRVAEQVFVYNIRKCDILTNPPWVGWEYMSRPYRNYVNPAWQAYSLFEQRGLEAAFLKEDLSTLCMVATFDHFLRDNGDCAAVLRPAAMHSDLSARGLRRLTVFAQSAPMKLQELRLFEDLQIFGNAAAPASTWKLSKGHRTHFPVPAKQWKRNLRAWQPSATTSLKEVEERVDETLLVCSPNDPSDYSSRWTIGGREADETRSLIRGENSLQARIGFFTGGANAIYYMEKIASLNEKVSKYSNIVDRAKKPVAKVTVDLEDELILSVVRGRDLSFWNSRSEVYVLCPHTRDTKIYPIKEVSFRENFPLGYSYLKGFENELRERNGFAGWEKKVHEDYFYTLQRIGDYTFAPYKVCWSYISSDFTISVLGPDARGVPIFPNDKVVFIPFENEIEAFFTAGILSSSPVRSSVVSSMSSRQVSTNVIKHIRLPDFNASESLHIEIADRCRLGHEAVAKGELDQAEDLYFSIDELVMKIFGLSKIQLSNFQRDLVQKLKNYPLKGGRSQSL